MARAFTMRWLMAGLVAVAVVTALQGPALANEEREKQIIRDGIHWMWQGDGPPSRLRSYLFRVYEGEHGIILRNATSARACVQKSAMAEHLYRLARRQGVDLRELHDLANYWLQTGQSHDGGVMEIYAKHWDYAIQYAYDNYYPHANNANPFSGDGLLWHWVLGWVGSTYNVSWLKWIFPWL